MDYLIMIGAMVAIVLFLRKAISNFRDRTTHNNKQEDNFAKYYRYE